MAALFSLENLHLNKPLCIQKYDRVCEAICLTHEAWLEFCLEIGQRSRAQHQIYNRMAAKEKNQGVAKTQSKSRPQVDGNARS